jgi:hypothetical protein
MPPGLLLMATASVLGSLVAEAVVLWSAANRKRYCNNGRI